MDNYAGEWTPRDPEKNDALFGIGLTDVPGRGRLMISIDASMLAISRTGPGAEPGPRDTIGAQVPARSVYDLSGRPTTHTSIAGPAVSRATAESNRIVVRTTLPQGELETVYSIAGGDLQVETTLWGPDGRPGSTVRLWYQRRR